MDTAQFLARLLPPGNFIAIGYNTKPGMKGAVQNFGNRFFTANDYNGAAGFIAWANKSGFDAYHANASFIHAEPENMNGRIKYKGARKQENVQSLRAFWIDLDIKRDGDDKVAGSYYVDAGEAIAWVARFMADTGLPKPNLGVNSGYGLHMYWVLEDALTRDEWQPYAHAFKTAMIASGFKGDPGISSDAARVLRPPGSRNMKVPTAPMPVNAIDKLASGDIPNASMLGKLQPWIARIPQVVGGKAASAKAGVVGSTVSALATGTGGIAGSVSSIFAGTAATNMNAAATAGVPARRPRSLAKIAAKCGQVSGSLATHGANDGYPLWYLGHLTLAHFCEDGPDYTHALSDGHAGYSAASTDAAVARVAIEVGRKGSGPPSCAHYERANPPACQACPLRNTLNSPWDLGIDDSDLPDRYRRANSGIQQQARTPDGELVWLEIARGDVKNPVLDWLPTGGHAITFEYVRGPLTRTIYVIASELGTEDMAVFRMFDSQGIHLQPGMEKRFRGFIMAWIESLIERKAARTEVIHPWGWASGPNGISGFALGGTLYRGNGTAEAAAGGDPELLAMYKPTGTLAKWQQAFDFVAAGRPDLQAIIASSFGAPLMRFTGQAGMVVSAWSRQSGVGKSAAMTVAQGIWASSNAMNSIDDTGNSVLAKVARTRAMVCLWDETRITDQDRAKQFVAMVFALTQGKEKARMRADTTLRTVGQWETILVCAANGSLMDYVVAQDEGTEAGALRVFEYPIVIPPMGASGSAALTIGLAKQNHGHAGVAYVQWLAANHAKAGAAVIAQADALIKKLGAEQSERLYIAGMSVMLVGARIATKIGVAKFDVPALEAFLCQTFIDLRHARRRDIMVSSKGYDLEQILSSFIAAHVGSKLVTDYFARQGKSAVNVLWYPQNTAAAIQVHISSKDAVLRFNRSTFIGWTRKRNMSGPDIVNAMGERWQATQAKANIGGGTNFAAGQLYCVEIPLSYPELAHYADEISNAATVAQPVSTAPKLRGNQPTV